MALPPVVQVFAVQADEFLAGIDAMLEENDRLIASVDESIASVGKLGAAADAATGGLDAQAAATERAAEQANIFVDAQGRLRLANGQFATSADKAALSADELAAAYDRAGVSATAAGDKAETSGKKAAAFGSAWKTALLGVGIAAVYGIDQAAKFQANMEQLHTQAGMAQSKLAGLSQQVLELAGKVGEGPQSLSESLYHVASNLVSTGASGAQMLNAVKVAAEGAQVGGADLVDVTNALGAAIASGIPGVQDYTRAMGFMNATVGAGDMHMQDLADAFGTGLLANIKMYGITLRDVSAALATYGDNNIRGAKAGTDLRMAVQALARPAVTTSGVWLDKMSLSADAFAKSMQRGGLNQALELLVSHMKEIGITGKEQGQVITDLFGKKAGGGIGVLVGEFDRFQGKYRDVQKGADQFAGDWNARTKTMAQQWNDLKSGAQALAISFGTVLLPAATKVVGVMAKFAAMLEQHPALAAFAGALLAVAVAFKVVAAAEAIFDAVTDANPVMLVVLAVIALAAGLYELYTHSKLVRDVIADIGRFFKSAWELALKGADAVIKWFVTGPLAFIRQQIGVFTKWWAQNGAEVRQVTSAIWRAISAVITTYWRVIWDGEIRPGLVILQAAWRLAWGLIRDTVRLVWNTIAAIIRTTIRVTLDVISVFLDILTGHWSKAGADLQRLTSDALHGIESIFRTFAAGAARLLWDAGVNIVRGLIGGIKSMAGAAWNTVKDLGSGLLHGAMSVLGISSPSKKFYGLGVMITKGLTLGIHESGAEAKAAAAKLADDVRKAFLAGQITHSEEDSLLASIGKRLATDLNTVASRQDRMRKVMHEIGLKLVAGLVGSMEDATSASQAKAAVNKLISYVQQAFNAGAISLTQATSMTKALDADSLKLQSLATRREAIAKQIAAAKNYAAQTTQNASQWAGLSSVAGSMTSGGMMYSGNLLAGMQANLGQIRAFNTAIKKLASLGLRRDLITQIIQMGPDQGLQVAEALIQGPASVIGQMNATQHQLAAATGQLGKAAANVMYDNGTQAGKGFLSGLKAQEGELTKMMDRLAKSMVTSMKREMHIGGGGSGGAMQVHVTVNGFVGSNHELAGIIHDVVQEETLRYARRNGLSNGLSLRQ